MALEGRVAALKSAVVAKDSKVAKLTHELSSLQLSCDDLSIKASTLECEKDKLVDQVSEMAATCFGLRDEVDGYKLFKEKVEDVQDGQILGRDLKLAVIKCLQSPEYLYALGGALGGAIDKGMQDGLAAGVDHGRAGRGLDDIAAYDPSAEANFVSAVNALRTVNFPLLAQLESQKDASMADIMDLLCLEGPAAETPGASQLQPSPKQLMYFWVSGYATDLSTTFVQANTVPPAPSAEVLLSPKTAFEHEELDTTPEHASAP
ncbi:hypothetical protein Tco_1147121 [Tanacetum coccineum]